MVSNVVSPCRGFSPAKSILSNKDWVWVTPTNRKIKIFYIDGTCPLIDNRHAVWRGVTHHQVYAWIMICQRRNEEWSIERSVVQDRGRIFDTVGYLASHWPTICRMFSIRSSNFIFSQTVILILIYNASLLLWYVTVFIFYLKNFVKRKMISLFF